MDKLELIQEAARRGILPENKKALYDEAVRRGLIKSAAPKAPNLMGAHSPELKPSHEPEQKTGDILEKTLKKSVQTLEPVYRPALEGGGAMLGGIVGGVGGIETGPGAIATAALGSGLGYSTGKQAANWLDEYAGIKPPEKLGQRLKESAIDVGVGAALEVGGQAIGPVVKSGTKLAGKIIKPILGRMSGVGTGAVEEALKASSQFDKALRGRISGEDIVSNAKTALNSLKDQRASSYQEQLAKITEAGKTIDIKPLTKDLKRLMNRYNVKILEDGTIDTARIAMGKTGRKDIAEIIETISQWGSKSGDTTAEGLDVLKRQLDDFYSDSSQARHFVSSIRDKVKSLISRNVPEYEKMVRGYSEATKLIKDIESGLMMRKQGISGRIVADQTLRRLMSSMKDNFQLRKELVDVLGNEGGQDLAGQISGFTMRSAVPVGLAGTGPALIAEAAYAFINPKFWPVLAASSPRIQGEFLRMIGKTMGHVYKNPEIEKEIFKQTSIYFNREKK